MSELQDNLTEILRQKNTYLLPTNIRSGVTILGVTGTLDQGTVIRNDLKLFIQDTEPSTYDGIWLNTSSLNYDYIIETTGTNLIANSINVIKGVEYETILFNSDVIGGLHYKFGGIYITDENNDIDYTIPIAYGDGLQWVDITPSQAHYMGVTVDYANKTYTKINGNANGDVNNLKCYKNRIRCNLQDDGTVTAYYGETSYDNSGNENLQVMVEQPVVYYSLQNVELDGNNITKADYLIADGPIEGFEVHPAFTMTDGISINDKIYINAYEATLSNDKLSSIAGSTPYVNATRGTFRTKASNRGSNWTQLLMQVNELEKLMQLIEYQSLNMQSVLAKGVTSSSAAVSVGSTYTLDSNGTGCASNLMPSTNSEAFTWRYRENTYGNVYKWNDAINIMSYVWYFRNTVANLTDDTSSGYTNPGISASSTSGWITRFGYAQNAKWMFIPTTVSSTESNSMCGDYYIQSSGNSVFSSGGDWLNGSVAGAFLSSASISSSSAYPNICGGLVYIPVVS